MGKLYEIHTIQLVENLCASFPLTPSGASFANYSPPLAPVPLCPQLSIGAHHLQLHAPTTIYIGLTELIIRWLRTPFTSTLDVWYLAVFSDVYSALEGRIKE